MLSGLFALSRRSIQTTTRLSFYSTMSAPTIFKFAIWAPDYSDEECLARRLSVRERHLANAKKLTEAGTLSTSCSSSFPLDVV